MYKKILVAIDQSEINNSILKAAINQAKATEATLHLLRVISLEDEHAPGLKEKDTPEYRRRWIVFENEQNQILESALNLVKEDGLNAEYSLLPGKPGQIICGLARDWQADLIIVGWRQKSGLQKLILGSVSNYVVHSAPCSVLVVKGFI